MNRTIPSLYTSNTDLFNNVQYLLENGQIPETVRCTVEAAVTQLSTRDMEPHGKCMYLL